MGLRWGWRFFSLGNWGPGDTAGLSHPPTLLSVPEQDHFPLGRPGYPAHRPQWYVLPLWQLGTCDKHRLLLGLFCVSTFVVCPLNSPLFLKNVWLKNFNLVPAELRQKELWPNVSWRISGAGPAETGRGGGRSLSHYSQLSGSHLGQRQGERWKHGGE